MVENYADLIQNLDVFENSGENLANYYLTKRNRQIPKKLFCRQPDCNDEEEHTSFRLPKKRKTAAAAAESQNSNLTIMSVSSGFVPPAFSTPYVREKPNCPKKIVSVPDKSYKHSLSGRRNSRSAPERDQQSEYIPCGPLSSKSPIITQPPINNESGVQSRVVAQKSIPQSPSVSSPGRQPSIGNVPDIHINVGMTPVVVLSPMNNFVKPRTPEAATEANDGEANGLEKSNQDLHKKQKEASSTSLRSTTVGEQKSGHKSKNFEEIPQMDLTSDDEEDQENMTDDESPGEQEQEQSPIRQKETTHRRSSNKYLVKTLHSSNMMEISEANAVQEKSQKPVQKTTTSVVIIPPASPSNSSTGSPSFRSVEDSSDDEDGNDQVLAQLKVIHQNEEVTSGFVDCTDHASVMNPPGKSAQNAPVLPRVSENCTSVSNATAQSNVTGINTANTPVFKVPEVTRPRRNKRKKLESPAKFVLALEETMKTAKPRKAGLSQRRLYSMSRSEGSLSPEDSEAQPMVVDQVVQESNPEDEIIVDQENNEGLMTSHLMRKEETVQKEPKKQDRKKRTKNKPKENIPPEIISPELSSDDGCAVRRSSRKRCAPRAFWYTAIKRPDLIIKTYDEKIPLRKRYAEEETGKSPDIHADFSMVQLKKSTLKKNKKKDPVRMEESKKPQVATEKSHTNSRKTKKKVQIVQESDPEEEDQPMDNAPETCSRSNTNYPAPIPVPSPDEIFDRLRNMSEEEERFELTCLLSSGDSRINLMDRFDVKTLLYEGVYKYEKENEDNCGYLVFEPGSRKKPCRVFAERCIFVVVKGSFTVQLNGIPKDAPETSVLIFKKDTKYALICKKENRKKSLIFYTNESSINGSTIL